MIKEVLHIGLTVKNIEKSIEFYRDIFRAEINRANGYAGQRNRCFI